MQCDLHRLFCTACPLIVSELLSDFITTQPHFSESDAERFIEDFYGIRGTVAALESERDQNFLVTTADSQQYVFKIANSQTNAALIDLENQAINRLKNSEIGSLVPGLIKTLSGKNTETLLNGSKRYAFRLIRFLQGNLLAKSKPHTDELLFELGSVLGKLTTALQGWEDAAAYRDFHWNLDHASSTVSGHLRYLKDTSLLEKHLARYHQRVEPKLAHLRKSIIHNDANDYNILVAPQGSVAGLIDFGDMTFASTINELAICLAYVMLDKPDPLWSASHVVRGFHAEFPLTEEEIEIVFDLACMRLCTSVVLAAFQRSLNPTNDYLSVSDQPARRLLQKLKTVHSDFAVAVFRSACQLAPFPQADSIENWLTENRKSAYPVLGCPFEQETVHVFDFSIASSEPIANTLGSDAPQLLFETLKKNDKKFGIGRYCEPRLCYQGEQFGSDDELEPRTIHMGMDVFALAGTEIHAPFQGRIHSFADNDLPYDYGPTIILEHSTSDGDTFLTLYGHLSRQSIANWVVGQQVEQGQAFASIGDQSVNGGWAPHLHFQIMTHDLGLQGDFPGVVKSRELAVWQRILLDPNLILQVPAACFPKLPMTGEEILAHRTTLLNPSLSLSYDEPLHLVRGEGTYLFNSNGHRYLDCVNNVCHVGHSHPDVVAAAARQWSVLNTNTRYLHAEIVRYAQRITETLPDELEVCYFVNSGSEANDLALRIARNFTGRREVICVEGGYHGNLSSLIEISPYKYDSPGGPGQPQHVHQVPLPDSFRGRHLQESTQTDLGEFYAQFVRAAIAASSRNSTSRSAKDHDVAAFICESILSCGGQIVLPDGYLSRAFQHAREQSVICIADEVQVGLGRVGTSCWAFENQDVVPDIVTMGKPLGNGFPLGAVVTTRPLAEAFNNGLEYFNTFGGSPVACAVGNAVLDVIDQQDLMTNAHQTGKYFLQQLEELKSQFLSVGDVRGQGLFLGIEFVQGKERNTPNPALAKYIVERMKALRILLSTDGPQHNVIKIKPPLVFQRQQVDQVINALHQVLQEDFPQEVEKAIQNCRNL